MSETLSIRVPHGTKDRLDRIGEATKRSRSFLAAQAVGRYVEEELAIIEGIERSMAEIVSGQVVPHIEVMAKAYATIEKARK